MSQAMELENYRISDFVLNRLSGDDIRGILFAQQRKIHTSVLPDRGTFEQIFTLKDDVVNYYYNHPCGEFVWHDYQFAVYFYILEYEEVYGEYPKDLPKVFEHHLDLYFDTMSEIIFDEIEYEDEGPFITLHKFMGNGKAHEKDYQLIKQLYFKGG
jgi:hypothetical protein